MSVRRSRDEAPVSHTAYAETARSVGTDKPAIYPRRSTQLGLADCTSRVQYHVGQQTISNRLLAPLHLAVDVGRLRRGSERRSALSRPRLAGARRIHGVPGILTRPSDLVGGVVRGPCTEGSPALSQTKAPETGTNLLDSARQDDPLSISTA